MKQVTWLILQRMRLPLLVLITTYSISIIGMVLVPGVDETGQTAHMDFFHAIYFVSYISTTIGLGEIPRAFTDAQRMWAIVTMYLTVIAWVYSIGAILTLTQNPAFRQTLVERRFANKVRRINEPFYLICGYGEAGSALVEAFTHYYIRVVVIDNNQDCINELNLKDQHYRVFVPGLCADAEIPEYLLAAGLCHPLCSRIIAVTGSDTVNLKIAITSKLLNPDLKVICRSDHADIAANMDSFGTDYIIDPFQVFSDLFSMALHSPDHYLLHKWMTGIAHSEFRKPDLPPGGKWIICGYGRLGRSLRQRLDDLDIASVIVEAKPESDCPAGFVLGQGTEANTLYEAGIQNALGIVAGTDNDVNNLSIIMTARELNPDLFIVARQNSMGNQALFDALKADMIFHPGLILADTIRCLLIPPLLKDFLRLVRQYNNAQARELMHSLTARLREMTIPDIWQVMITRDEAEGIYNVIGEGSEISLTCLMRNPVRRDEQSACYPLLVRRGKERFLLPEENFVLYQGDRILFCGTHESFTGMQLLARNYYLFKEVLTGQHVPRSLLWQWICKRRDNHHTIKA